MVQQEEKSDLEDVMLSHHNSREVFNDELCLNGIVLPRIIKVPNGRQEDAEHFEDPTELLPTTEGKKIPGSQFVCMSRLEILQFTAALSSGRSHSL